MLTETEGTR